MIPCPLYSHQHVGVFGLARSGLAAARALAEGHAIVHAFDDNTKAQDAAAALSIAPKPWDDWPWERLAALVLSPGIPLTHPKPHPIVLRAQDAGVPVIGDIELFARTIAASAAGATCPLICVTGTNGKSTTTALIGHLLQRAGHQAEVGGNIGAAVFDLAPPRPGRVYVIETSSYQIDLSPNLRPQVAVLTNITPDHLDRHGSLENYIRVKQRLFALQGPGDSAVIGVDDAPSAETCTRVTARGGPAVLPVSVNQVLGRGIYVVDGVLYDGIASPATAVCDLKAAPALVGKHNWQNAALAFGAVRGLIKDPRDAARGLMSFPGLAHRLERAGQIGPVLFVNDSKATNADAAARALDSYRTIYWIAGGKAKEGGIASLAPFFPRIKRAYLIGDAQDSFAATLEGAVPFDLSGDMRTATAKALADALRERAEEPVVLLSPACASFDQFRDFEDRGDQFKAFVKELARECGAGHAA
ncbi:MAG: UDP-N-acetylmuramoyl-L-alanine--D-glutamate ligase [Alphaproteobacteria bacterium]|nr:UDP-N-acetylmuramoyl-L-alanine--D-glutamate ligase [Alphaproteobacteria bacterium]